MQLVTLPVFFLVFSCDSAKAGIFPNSNVMSATFMRISWYPWTSKMALVINMVYMYAEATELHFSFLDCNRS